MALVRHRRKSYRPPRRDGFIILAMGRLARRYEREAAEWSVAVVQLALLLPVIIAFLAVGVAIFCIVLAWFIAAAATWLISWPIGAASPDRGRSVRDAGVRLLGADPAHAVAEPARDVLRSQRVRERAAARRYAEEAPVRAALAEAEAKADAQRAEAKAQARADAQRKWLEGPPPTLYVPRRSTEHWFADNLPNLHPGQVRPLLQELYARGWTNERIEQRLHRYFKQNQFMHGVTSEQLMAGDSAVAAQPPAQ
jgi:hypothetical protein